MDVTDIWGSADYAPTAARLDAAAHVVAEWVAEHAGPGARVVEIGAGHGNLTRLLVDAGFDVVAVEPVERMVAVGRERCPEASWVQALGESTGLPDESCDVVASNFGAFLCDPVAGGPEWGRILVPGGRIVHTAWDERGFLAEMTRRMSDAVQPGAGATPAPHMRWGRPGEAEARLPGFEGIVVEPKALPWRFPSVEEGMRLYLEGSPTHTFSLAMAGDRRDVLLEALRAHLEEAAGPGGAVDDVAGYVLVSARRAA